MSRRQISFMLSCLVLVIMSGLWGYVNSIFKETEKDLLVKANNVFDNVVRQDKAQRGEGLLNDFRSAKQITHSPSKSVAIVTDREVADIKKPDKEKLSFEDKKYIGDHLYLLSKNPIQVNRLDSLFKAMLTENGLLVETAIVYTVKDKSEYSDPDSSFYKNAIALDVLSIGNIINLQGYIKLTNWYIWNKIPFIWGILLSCMVLIAFLLVYIIFDWRNWKVISHLKPIEKLSSGYKKIGEGLYFNEREGMIKYKDNVYLLSKKSADLLKYLFQGDNWFQTYESIKKEVWYDETTNTEAVRKVADRLNKELNDIPGFHIQKIIKKGLQICIE